jgi:hypothetical protein
MKTFAQILGIFTGAIFWIAALGLFTMLLWNWLMPEIFGLKTINYWQAAGLMALANLIFPSGRSTITNL